MTDPRNNVPFHIWRRIMEEPPAPGRAGADNSNHTVCLFPKLYLDGRCLTCRIHALCRCDRKIKIHEKK